MRRINMKLELDVIAVLVVFIVFCIGSILLSRVANKEISKKPPKF